MFGRDKNKMTLNELSKYVKHRYQLLGQGDLIPTMKPDFVLQHRFNLIRVYDNKLSQVRDLPMDEIFSEGNENLKRLLNTLWDNYILTRGTCAGHQVYMPKSNLLYDLKAYISFIPKKDYSRILEMLKHSSRDYGFEISSGGNVITCQIHPLNADCMFKIINDTISSLYDNCLTLDGTPPRRK